MHHKTMAGKTCLITGGTSGIGKATALALAGRGATVIIVARDKLNGWKTINKIKKRTGNQKVDFLLADLSAQDDIRKLATEFKQNYDRLDVLINNAGARFLQYKQSKDGLEMTFALNHLAYFLLTDQLLDTIKTSTPARIINVSSGNLSSEIDFDNLNQQDTYDGRKAYSQSKLANLLFTQVLAKKLAKDNITVNALTPGAVATSFSRNNGWQYWLSHVLYCIKSGDFKTPGQGAYATIQLASSSVYENVSGYYFTNTEGLPSRILQYDENMAQRLWQVSEEIIQSKK